MLWVLPTGKDNLPAFIDLARKATNLRPCIAKNWEILARHLFRTGADEEAISVLSEAVSKHPKEPRLYLMLANGYNRARRFDLVREILDRTPTIPIDDQETALFHLELLMKMRVAEDPAQVATTVLALDPTNIEAIRTLAKVSRETRRPEIMVPICQTALKHQPGHTRARYELAVTFALLGRCEEARQLIDLERFVAVTELATPEAYADAGTFGAALTNEIARNPTLKPDPVGLATEGGFQTMDRLPHVGDRAITELLNLVRSAVDALETKLSQGPDDPFVERRPKQAWLNAWAVVYPGNGRQVAHIHADGWLSGVYYVSAPNATCNDDPRSGSLVLGALEITGSSVDPPWGVRDIRPVPGRLVLFPSYVPHATIPTESARARICIAFDVVPVGN